MLKVKLSITGKMARTNQSAQNPADKAEVRTEETVDLKMEDLDIKAYQVQRHPRSLTPT